MSHIEFLTNLCLIVQPCRCGYLTIHGFPHQIRWLRTADNRVQPIAHCESCGLAFPHAWRIVDTDELTAEERARDEAEQAMLERFEAEIKRLGP